MKFRSRRAAAADAFNDALTAGVADTPEHEAMMLALSALRPVQPLSESRRAATKAAMLRAASLPDAPPPGDASGSQDGLPTAPLVHTAEVLIDGDLIRVADLEPLDEARALSAAWKVSRQAHMSHGRDG